MEWDVKKKIMMGQRREKRANFFMLLICDEWRKIRFKLLLTVIRNVSRENSTVQV